MTVSAHAGADVFAERTGAEIIVAQAQSAHVTRRIDDVITHPEYVRYSAADQGAGGGGGGQRRAAPAHPPRPRPPASPPPRPPSPFPLAPTLLLPRPPRAGVRRGIGRIPGELS